MPHGPVLSFTLDKINDSAPPDGSSYWHRCISECRGHEVALIAGVPNDQLSPAEEQLLDGVFAEFGGMSQWEIRDYSDALPEWRDPNGSNLPSLGATFYWQRGFRRTTSTTSKRGSGRRSSPRTCWRDDRR